MLVRLQDELEQNRQEKLLEQRRLQGWWSSRQASLMEAQASAKDDRRPAATHRA
ncbi:MAG: hypothetical protein U0163_06490 [Gemmatimonadaceae bacterium]